MSHSLYVLKQVAGYGFYIDPIYMKPLIGLYAAKVASQYIYAARDIPRLSAF